MWNLTQLKNELSKRSVIKGWAISQENVHRRERYFMADGPTLVSDQDREVHSQDIWLTLFVRLDSKPVSKNNRQGEISKKLFPSLSLGPQIDSAIQAALQTDHQVWELPKELPNLMEPLRTIDPRIAEDIEKATAALTDRIARAVAQPRATLFNSAELFLSMHAHELHLSNGLVHRSSRSRIYNEAAYSYQKSTSGNQPPRSDEYLNTRWAVSMDDLDIEKLFDETSERAEHSLDTDKPETGVYSIIVDAEVLSTLFNAQMGSFSAGNAYDGLPFINPGDELVPGVHGDRITLTLDPTLEFGADTVSLSSQGIVQTPLKVVADNQVLATLTEKRYADYLGLPASTTRGAIVIPAGTRTYAELTQSAPKVIEILQFSSLFVRPHSMSFGSEIRLARLYDNEKGTVTYLKGGSLSGSFRENFRGARFSNRCVRRAHFPYATSGNAAHAEGYFGPEYALLTDVSIVG